MIDRWNEFVTENHKAPPLYNRSISGLSGGRPGGQGTVYINTFAKIELTK
jgi:hypothetical protein